MHFLHFFHAVHKAVFLLLFSTLLFLPLFTTFTFTSAYCARSCFFFLFVSHSIYLFNILQLHCFGAFSALHFCIAIFLFCFPSFLPPPLCDPGCFSFFLFLLQFVFSFSPLTAFFIGLVFWSLDLVFPALSFAALNALMLLLLFYFKMQGMSRSSCEFNHRHLDYRHQWDHLYHHHLFKLKINKTKKNGENEEWDAEYKQTRTNGKQ